MGNNAGIAYCGIRWSWQPRVYDPQASWQNVPVHYSSPSLPPWLSWDGDVLSGIPPPGAQGTNITVIAKVRIFRVYCMLPNVTSSLCSMVKRGS